MIARGETQIWNSFIGGIIAFKTRKSLVSRLSSSLYLSSFVTPNTSRGHNTQHIMIRRNNNILIRFIRNLRSPPTSIRQSPITPIPNLLRLLYPRLPRSPHLGSETPPRPAHFLQTLPFPDPHGVERERVLGKYCWVECYDRGGACGKWAVCDSEGE